MILNLNYLSDSEHLIYYCITKEFKLMKLLTLVCREEVPLLEISIKPQIREKAYTISDKILWEF